MSEPFIGQITMFGGNFAPRNWAFCDGQLLNISTNTALFSILGTTYGGDGRTTFGLPDLRGRSPVHDGSGPGLTTRRLGQKAGTETNTLTTQNLPSHNHGAVVRASSAQANSVDPTNNYLTSFEGYNSVGPGVSMGADSVQVSNTGSNQSFNNMHPFLVINFIIALVGLFPSRN